MIHKKHARFFHKIIHLLEYLIAALTIVVLVFWVGLEVYRMFTTDGYFATADTYLHNILTVVVGLEFVRMLINLTPANTIEVLIVAIARQVIVNHNNYISNIASVLCIAGLFAIRRFLIPRDEFKREIAEDEVTSDEATAKSESEAQ